VNRAGTVALAFAALGAFAPASYASGWVDSGPLSPQGRIATEPQVGFGPDGERVVAWIDESRPFQDEDLLVRVAPKSGAFGPPQSFPGSPEDLQLATAGDGTIDLAWIDRDDGTVRVARRAPGQQQFVEATPISAPGGGFLNRLKLTTDGDQLFLSFDDETQQTTSLWAAHLPADSNVLQIIPGSGAAGAIAQLSTTSADSTVELINGGIAAENGHVSVAFTRAVTGPSNGHGSADVDVAVRLAGGPDGTFEPALALDTLNGFSSFAPEPSPQITAAAGHTYVAWLREGDDQPLVYEDIGTGGARQTIASDGDVVAFLIGTDQSGALIVAGQGFPPLSESEIISQAVIPPGASSPRLSALTGAGLNRELDALAVAPDGTTLVLPALELDTSTQSMIDEAVFRPAGGDFGPLEEVSGPQDGPADFREAPAGAVASGGQAIAAWSASDHGGANSQRLHVAERDATPPTLQAVRVPARAAVGQRVALSTAASDDLSTPTVVWDFGDGSHATGADVAHVFGTTGAHTVTVTATDSVGNSVSATRVVAITAPGSGDMTPPTVTQLRQAHRHVSLRLSEQATVVLVMSQRGRVRAVLVRAGAGPGVVRISLGRLHAGRYRATVTAIDGAGNRSRPRSLKFKLVGS
jgi:hypothetical protein